MSTKTRCKETVNECIGKMIESMNRIIEHSQISTLEGTAYDSYLSSFSMKIQIQKIALHVPGFGSPASGCSQELICLKHWFVRL
ncbi:DnaJ domain containing protein [Cryptosporidium felis]|nr:DnaJ domain containing protein [Cryptosporidium felis]